MNITKEQFIKTLREYLKKQPEYGCVDMVEEIITNYQNNYGGFDKVYAAYYAALFFAVEADLTTDEAEDFNNEVLSLKSYLMD